MNKHHFLVLSLPAQGHLNPTLQLAKNLARVRAPSTQTRHPPSDRQLISHFDGYNDDNTRSFKPGYLDELKLVGSTNLTKLLEKLSSEGRPITFLVYTILLTWVAEVARENHLPSAFLSIQSATAFAIYHHFFKKNDGIHSTNKTYDPSISKELPGLPPLTYNDLPSFLLPDHPHSSAMIPIIQRIGQIDNGRF